MQTILITMTFFDFRVLRIMYVAHNFHVLA